jgi:hypothetical protein
MRTTTLRISLVALAAIMLAFLLAAIAVAQSGDGDGETGEQTTLTETPAATLSPGEKASAEPTAEPTALPTDPAAVPTDDANLPEATNVQPEDEDDTAESEGDSAVGTTTATNPGGQCVDLPNDSDMLRNPDKHPNWTVGSCDPGQASGPDGDPPDVGDENGPPEGRTPSLNADGVCVALPNNSDIVRNPDKHPNWVVGGCDSPSE